jgi:hypothetical protein
LKGLGKSVEIKKALKKAIAFLQLNRMENKGGGIFTIAFSSDKLSYYLLSVRQFWTILDIETKGE